MSIGIARSYIISAHEHLKPSRNLSTHKKTHCKKKTRNKSAHIECGLAKHNIACIALICFLSNDNDDNNKKCPLHLKLQTANCVIQRNLDGRSAVSLKMKTDFPKGKSMDFDPAINNRN